MNSFVLDTYPLYWYLTDSDKLSERARDIFVQADNGQAMLVIPAMALAELLATYEKFKPAREFNEDLEFRKDANQFRLAAFEPDDRLFVAPPSAIPELHDRIIVATALKLHLPCITKDSHIVQSQLVETVW